MKKEQIIAKELVLFQQFCEGKTQGQIMEQMIFLVKSVNEKIDNLFLQNSLPIAFGDYLNGKQLYNNIVFLNNNNLPDYEKYKQYCNEKQNIIQYASLVLAGSQTRKYLSQTNF
jgi:hypothetical protein